MTDERRREGRPAYESTGSPRRIASSRAGEGPHQTAGDAITGRRPWVLVGLVFVLLAIVVLANEVLDVPHHLLGAPATPLNWTEALMEALLIATVGAFAVRSCVHSTAVRRQAEAASRKAHDELESRVEERTEDLARANEALRLESIERKRMEEELRESELKYRTVVEDLPALICCFEPDGTLSFVNKAYCRYFGRKPEELIGQDFFQFISEKDRAEVEGYYRSIHPEKPVGTYEHPVVGPDGTIRWQRWTDRGLFDESGTLVEYQSIGEDITERKQAEAALRDSEEEYRLLAENTLDVIWKMDLDLEFTYVNPSVFQMLGFTPEEWVGSRLPEHCSPEEMGRMMEIITHEVENPETHTGAAFEATFRNKKGQGIDCEVNGKLIFDETGRPTGFQGTTRDITERRRAKRALQEYSERLEEMVEERTRELREAQEQLIRREKLAVLGQMAGEVGHEMRNPLAVISNAVYYLQMVHTDAGETREYLDMISAEIHRSEQILSDLLSLPQTRAAAREQTNVSGLVAEVLERRSPPENVAVDVVLPDDLPSVYVDPVQMEQVLGNLVANAYQAMPDGGRLTLRARAEEAEGGEGRVVLIVADVGCGIPEEYMDKIFEPLFTTRNRGIGLGLAVSKNLLDLNGGSIEVESRVDEGSTFTVTLPTGKAVE